MIDLNCFPNPATNVLKINYNSKDFDKIFFEVIDVLGSIVLSYTDREISLSESEFHEIDISSLEKGLYFLSARSTTNKQTISFFVE